MLIEDRVFSCVEVSEILLLNYELQWYLCKSAIVFLNLEGLEGRNCLASFPIILEAAAVVSPLVYFTCANSEGLVISKS